MKYKTMQEIETRKAAILQEMEQEGADLDALKKEMDELRENAQQIREAAAQAEETRKAIASGAAGIVIGETYKAEPEHTEKEVRNSPEYIEAYANYVKTGNAQECRTVLLSKNAPASGQLPVPDMLEGIIKTAWEKNEFLNHIKKTAFRGNLRVPFELSATGAWKHVEGTTGLTEEEITIGIVTLTPHNIKKLVRFTDECMAMGGEEFIRYIYDEVAYRVLAELVKEIIDYIDDLSTSNSSTAIGIPKVKVAPGVMTLENAATNLSEEATDLCVVMNRLTEQAFNTAYAGASFAINPWAGMTRIYTTAMPAYSAASENDMYALVGDLKAIQANYPEGEGVIIKWDDLSEAEDDLVKVVGRQYAGFGVTAPGRLVKLTKPGS